MSLMLIGLALAFAVSSLLYLALNPRQKELVLDRLRIRGRRASSSFTPPRSLSPEKQGLPTNKPVAYPTYAEVFPPSRRAALGELADDALRGAGSLSESLSGQAPDHSKPLPDKEKIDVEDAKWAHHVTPTGFTVEEVRRLGSFPDYATLSGVPLPQKYEGFDVETARARPYRPFRWAYHQTMSLQKFEPDWWLEVTSNYVSVMKQRQELYESAGSDILQTLPGSELACKELMEMCLQFYCARYPQHFSLSPDKKIFHNNLLQTQTDLTTTAPLHVLLQNVAEDFAITLRDPSTGLYSFRAGMICSSLGWSVGTKIGKLLHEIHEHIPDYREKMQFSMDRYFAKKPTDKPIQRGSWGIEIDEPLFMPPGHPHEELRSEQNPEHTIERCRLRVDWQTLRRLPLSGAIVFNFKGLFTPVTEFRDEPYVPTLLLKVLREGKKNLMDYKGTWHTEHVVVPAMEGYEREQKEKGLMDQDWEPRTLDENPFYPGWEEKWHRQQGF